MTGPDEDPAHDRVRALLADLGSAGADRPGPVPDDVAARLDATLADLRPPARRRWPQLLVAAAVAVVVGAGAVTATLATRGAGDPAGDGGAAGGSASSAQSERAEDSSAPALTRAGFATEVAALLSDPAAEARRPGRATLSAGCATPPGRGEVLAVRFEGEPAVIALRPERDGRRVVEAWTCDASRVLARTRVASAGDQPPD